MVDPLPGEKNGKPFGKRLNIAATTAECIKTSIKPDTPEFISSLVAHNVFAEAENANYHPAFSSDLTLIK